MPRPNRIVISLALVAVCALVLHWLYHRRMAGRPALIYSHYQRDLEDYGQRLANGGVQSEPSRGYAIPQFLLDKGAKLVTKNGGRYAVWFTSMLDNPTPVLWYSPNGFDPPPPELAKVLVEPKALWQQLSPKWGACYLPWWLNP